MIDWRIMKKIFKPTILGGMGCYEAIENYEDSIALKKEFQEVTGKKGETELYKYIRDFKLKTPKK